MIISKIQRYIDEQHLFTLGDKILVAVSGGPDSVALLYVLDKLGYNLEVAHCNFHLRGDESDRDERFVRELCKTFGVVLHVTHFDTKFYAKEHHVSIEMAARDLRYDWFQSLRLHVGADWIAIAHHRDDSIETMLMNLIRGTGINGLLGIQPQNGYVVRPLLCIDREQIMNLLNENGLHFVLDSTNMENEFTRNKIRLDLIPLMESINPSVKAALSLTAIHLNDAAKIYNEAIQNGRIRVTTDKGIVIDWLMQEPSPHALLFEILYPLGFTPPQIDSIFISLNGQSGKMFESEAWMAVKDRDCLLLKKKQSNQIISPKLIIENIDRTPDFIIPRHPGFACLDANLIKHPLTIRKWQSGDKFVPFGMNGSKLVSDYMIDKKFSLLKKEDQWVVCCGDDIVWLVNERSDNRYRVTDQTKKIILLKVKLK